MATIDLLEETANYLLNHCFVLGCVEEQRAKYLYIQDHLNEVRAVFKPLGYAVLLYPAPMQAAALVNEHEAVRHGCSSTRASCCWCCGFCTCKSGKALPPARTRCWSRWKRCRQNCKR